MIKFDNDDGKLVIEEESSNLKCYHCGTLLTKSEATNYYEDAEYCCNGYMCGCMGMPINPPYCDRCIETARLTEIGEALEWLMNLRDYDMVYDIFDTHWDINVLLKYFRERKTK